MGRLADKLASGEKVFTAEITPPKGAGIKKMVSHAHLLGPVVDAINITDCQRALVKMASVAACRVLIDEGFEPVLQMTCRDRNAIAIQADLMGAYALGISNLLCLTGDPVKVGDSPNSKSVFEMETVKLLSLVQSLQAGRDGEGNKLNAATKFFVGAVVNPTQTAAATQLARMEKKIQAGARFFQTQANYDLDDFAAFLEQAKPLGGKMLAGVLVLPSASIAKFIHDNIPGIRFPGELLERYRTTADARALGIDFAVETMLRLDSVVDGFHLMTIREEELIPEVMEKYHAARSR